MGFWDNFSDGGKGASGDDRDNRTEHRDSLFLLAKIHFSKSAKVVDVRVRNLSAGGMMAESNIYCERGDRVVVKIANLEDIDGRVSWHASGRFGVAFDQPIDPQEARSKKGGDNKYSPSNMHRGGRLAKQPPGRVRRI
ncbi:MAG: PilZ domain-containing protein [Pseudomonadota bacterium]